MKKIYVNTLLALAVVTIGFFVGKNEAQAATEELAWTVSYNGSAMTSDYNVDKSTILGIFPGDTVSYQVTYANNSDKAADFYMSSDVLKSLEDDTDGNTSGGGYSYSVSYTLSGTTTSIYSNDTLGGDNADIVGLNQATDNKNTYVYVGRLSAGQSGLVTINVVLDGNSQDNSYMTKLATLDIRFGVEAVTSTVNHVSNSQSVVYTLPGNVEVVTISDDATPTTGGNPVSGSNPRTGDSILPLVFCGIALILGIILVVWYFFLTRKNNQEVA